MHTYSRAQDTLSPVRGATAAPSPTSPINGRLGGMGAMGWLGECNFTDTSAFQFLIQNYSTFWKIEKILCFHLFATSVAQKSYFSIFIVAINQSRPRTEKYFFMPHWSRRTPKKYLSIFQHAAKLWMRKWATLNSRRECDLQKSHFWPPALSSLNGKAVKSCGIYPGPLYSFLGIQKVQMHWTKCLRKTARKKRPELSLFQSIHSKTWSVLDHFKFPSRMRFAKVTFLTAGTE